jgi:hypothetical protein
MSTAVRLKPENHRDLETIRQFLCGGYEGRKLVTTARCIRFAITNAAMFVRGRNLEILAEQRKGMENGIGTGTNQAIAGLP